MTNKKIMTKSRLGSRKLMHVSCLIKQELWRVAQVRLLLGKKLVIKEGIGKNRLPQMGKETGRRELMVHSISSEMEWEPVIGHRKLPEIQLGKILIHRRLKEFGRTITQGKLLVIGLKDLLQLQGIAVVFRLEDSIDFILLMMIMCTVWSLENF
jgi:hypothetical protein